MWSNRQETADLVAFTEEILNGKLRFLCSANCLCSFCCIEELVLILDYLLFRNSHSEVFWKYEASLQENTHAEVRFK